MQRLHDKAAEWLVAEFKARYPDDTTDIAPIVAETRAAFETADTGRRGELDVAGALAAFHVLQRDKSLDDVKEAMLAVDRSSAGAVRLLEFVNMILLEDGLIIEPLALEATPQPPLTKAAVVTPSKSTLGLQRAYAAKLGAVAAVKRGYVKLSAMLDLGTHVLSLAVVEAVHLTLAKAGQRVPDAYVKARLVPDVPGDAGGKRKTDVVPGTRCPVFQRTLTWALPEGLDLKTHRVVVGVWDATSRKQCIGALSFSLAELAAEAEIFALPAWYVLMDADRGAAQHFRCRDIAMPAALRIPTAATASGSAAAAAARPLTAKKRGGSLAETLSMLTVLGRGSFGRVVLARAGKQLYAVKILSKHEVLESDAVETVLVRGPQV